MLNNKGSAAAAAAAAAAVATDHQLTRHVAHALSTTTAGEPPSEFERVSEHPSDFPSRLGRRIQALPYPSGSAQRPSQGNAQQTVPVLVSSSEAQRGGYENGYANSTTHADNQQPSNQVLASGGPGSGDAVKAFACETCGKGFARRSDLARHEAAVATAAALASRPPTLTQQTSSEGGNYSDTASGTSTPSPGRRNPSLSPSSEVSRMPNISRQSVDYSYMNSGPLPHHLRHDLQPSSLRSSPSIASPTLSAYGGAPPALNQHRPSLTSHPAMYGPPPVLEPPTHAEHRHSGSSGSSPHLSSVGWQSPIPGMGSPTRDSYSYPEPPFAQATTHLYYPNSNLRRPQSTEPNEFEAKPRMGGGEVWAGTDFLAGQLFDIRLEVHAPVNGSEATGNPNPDTNFAFTIARQGRRPQSASSYFKIEEPALERWNFTWYEDRFAQDAKNASLVNVAAKAYRRVALYQAGEYTATLTYNNGQTTTASWLVRDLATARKTKNIVLFIGHSIDSFITDSANSATALYSGHKSTVNSLGVYRDSSPSPFDDPKFESIAEIFQRLTKGGVGIVSTAFIADATPAAFTAHTADRGQYGHVVDTFLNGLTNYTWTNWTGPDVLFGGGAEQFIPGSRSYKRQDYYKLFQDRGYNVVQNNTALSATPNNAKTLGIFTTSNLPVWLDRNVYKQNLNRQNSPDGLRRNATDVPGLKEMTLKAVDILTARHRKEGWFLMSEAASIDKQMHALDYDRALGDVLELDDTIRATIAKLGQLNSLKETLVLVTADHGHGFDVAGSVDTEYLNAQNTDRKKRDAVGTYAESGLSQYVIPGSAQDTNSLQMGESPAFPANWDPRYTLLSGVSANPDRRENYQVHKSSPRNPTMNTTAAEDDYIVNYKDAVTGFVSNGTLPVDSPTGVHSLTDVPVFAQGPCQEMFSGVYNNIEIFFNMAACLGLARSK
ncbi:MAG: hypothetical protein LQ344_005204 [Seirophora lacunosa]|nr:MAG: hypothetical protein LQ344_005204 [Seirophora lacunosa]